VALVYVSSTYDDLQECRKQVSTIIRKMGHEDVAMEYYTAENQRPLDRCLRDVGACDVYIGIFAWRYGWVAPDQNVEQRSITEMEYRQAVRTGKHCLIFLLEEDAPWGYAALRRTNRAGHLQTTCVHFRQLFTVSGITTRGAPARE
jgi:hypothetical protein